VCQPRKNILKLLEKDLAQVGKLAEPIFLCFTCDPYPCGVGNITREAIQLIKASGNNVRILTKGPGYAARDFDLLDYNDEFGVTLTFCDLDDSRLWEPGAQSAGMRLDCLRVAKQAGIKTMASFEPVIHPAQTLHLIESAALYCDIAKIGRANHLSRWAWPQEDEWRRMVESIDWADFGMRAVELCERLGLEYYIKQDLREAMEAAK
jgi:DNA repair photolyase